MVTTINKEIDKNIEKKIKTFFVKAKTKKDDKKKENKETTEKKYSSKDYFDDGLTAGVTKEDFDKERLLVCRMFGLTEQDMRSNSVSEEFFDSCKKSKNKATKKIVDEFPKGEKEETEETDFAKHVKNMYKKKENHKNGKKKLPVVITDVEKKADRPTRQMIKSNKLVSFVVGYLKGSINKIPKLDNDSMIFCNSVANFMVEGKIIFENTDVAGKLIDLETLDYTNPKHDAGAKFTISIENLQKKKEKYFSNVTVEDDDIVIPKFTITESDDNSYVDKFKKIIDLTPNEVKEIKEEIEDPSILDVEKPILEAYKDQIKDPLFLVDENVTEEGKKELDSIIEPYFDISIYHKYEITKEGLFKLHYVNDGVEAIRLLDAFGVIMGGEKPYILADIQGNDTMMVPLDYHGHGLVNYLFKNPFYVIDPVTCQDIMKEYLSYQEIYRWIDFSNTKWMSTLSQEDKDKLSFKLHWLIGYVYQNNGLLPRMRFEYFNNVDDFKIESSFECLSPLKDSGITEATVIEGLSYTFKAHEIEQDLNGQKLVFNINTLY